MKSILMVLVLLFAAKSFALEIDVKPEYGTPEWKEFSQAWKDAKAAHAAGDYAKQAELAPYSWVKAWAYYDAAGKLATGDKEDGLWNFDYQLDATTLAQVKEYLDKSEAAMNDAIKANLIPASGPNIMEHLKANIDHARKMLAE